MHTAFVCSSVSTLLPRYSAFARSLQTRRTRTTVGKCRPGASMMHLPAPEAAILSSVEISLSLGHSLQMVLFGPLFEALNSDTDVFTRVLVWTNFRVAVALFVTMPLVLFAWSFARGGTQDAVKRVLLGYWQASSLLMLTVWMNIAEVPCASFTGLFVQVMIPIALTWWEDLIKEVEEDSSALARAFLFWRTPAIVASIAGVAIQTPFQGCNFEAIPRDNPMCAAWLEPPLAFHKLDILSNQVPPSTLKGLAFVGCSIYFAYLGYLAVRVVPKVGRSGRKDRGMFSSVSALKWLGWVDRESAGN
jgi:Protein of unknown function (DUF3177)